MIPNIDSIFPSSENLYKFLFLSGVAMAIFAFTFPYQKQKEIDLEIIELQKVYEITVLKFQNDTAKINTLRKTGKSNQRKFNILKSVEKPNGLQKTELENLFKSNSMIIAKIDSIILQSQLSQAEFKAQKAKVETLKKYLAFFSAYQVSFLWGGIIMGLFGLFRWYKLMRKFEHTL